MTNTELEITKLGLQIANMRGECNAMEREITYLRGALEAKQNFIKPDVSSTLLSVCWLMGRHIELSETEAESLLRYCNERTITHKDCYGDGSIMFPRWRKWKESN